MPTARGSTTTRTRQPSCKATPFQDVETEVVGRDEFIGAGAANPAGDDGTAKDTANDDLANDGLANDDGFPNDGAVNGGLANDGGAKTADDPIDAPDKGFLPGGLFVYTTKNSYSSTGIDFTDISVNDHDRREGAGSDGGVGDWWFGFC